MLMTPGPTEIPETTRQALARSIHNPDIEDSFKDFYRSLTEKIKRFYRTEDSMVILGGEGILGLEASMASLLEEGDKVLSISNGIYGDGFADFAEMYGGEVLSCKVDYDQPLDPNLVRSKLEDKEVQVATMVHCETPTGVLNDIGEILALLKDRGIITVVDAVSSLGGAEVPTEHMDVCICGSQKCLSSPPGLTMLSVSEEAWTKIMETPARSFYTSLRPWKEMWYEQEFFPYTHLVSNLYGLECSVDALLQEGLENVFARHRSAAELCRRMGREAGLSLYPIDASLSSPTVTAFHIPGQAKEVQRLLYETTDILIATGLGEMENDLIRIGHMGYNAHRDKVKKTMTALEKVLRDIG